MTPSARSVTGCYRYDPLDRLAFTAATGQACVRRFYRKNRLSTEIQNATCRQILQLDEGLLAQRQSGSFTATRLLATDSQQSVLQTIDEARSVALMYSAYGYHHAQNGLETLPGFNGERPDPVSGHYLLGNGYRLFNPVLMRFNSPDNLSPFGPGGINAYAYCQGNPINTRDPTGHIVGPGYWSRQSNSRVAVPRPLRSESPSRGVLTSSVLGTPQQESSYAARVTETALAQASTNAATRRRLSSEQVDRPPVPERRIEFREDAFFAIYSRESIETMSDFHYDRFMRANLTIINDMEQSLEASRNGLNAMMMCIDEGDRIRRSLSQ